MLARLAPEKFFRIGSSFRYPLCRSEHTHLRRQWLAAQIAARLTLHSDVARMCGDILLEFFYQECVNDFRFIVRHALVEALVKRKQMARRTSVGEFYRRHQLTAGDRPGWPKRDGAKRTDLLLIPVADGSSPIACISVS